MAESRAITGYLAPEGFVDELLYELGDATLEVHGRLVLARGPQRPVAWAANVWLDPVRLGIASIGDAAKQLRAMQRNWALYAHRQHRRAALIAAKLPKVSAKPLRFGDPAPKAPLGSWTLLDPDTLAGGAALHQPLSQWRGPLRRGPDAHRRAAPI